MIEAKDRKTIVARMKTCGRNSGRLGEARQRERETGIEIAQLQHVNELCYVIECEDVSNAFVKRLESTAGGMKVMSKGKVSIITNSEEIRDRCRKGQGAWSATVMSLDEILVKTGRKTEGNEGTCVPDEVMDMELSVLDGEYWDDLSGARLD